MHKVINTLAPVGEITSAGHRQHLVSELLSALVNIDDRYHHRNDKIDEVAAIMAEAAEWGLEHDIVIAYGRAMADQAKEDARRHLPRTEINGMPIIEMRRNFREYICVLYRGAKYDKTRDHCVVVWDGKGDSWYYAKAYDLSRDQAIDLLRNGRPSK